ncbi:MAG: threonine synthase [Streptosporangiales bacterium]|nr:threonine synthase [Streptosporangiales bacterium]
MPFTTLTHLDCSACGRVHDASVWQGLCVDCGSPLLARYDLSAAAKAVDPKVIETRAPDLWRYRELLPVGSGEHITGFGEGFTPLIPAPTMGERLGVRNLLIKDESPLPTGSFKARGAAVGVSKARELGARRLAMPTNGNAGAAWAAYCARAGLSLLTVLPEDAPHVNRRECRVLGADTYLVDGLISDAGKLSKAALGPGDRDVATLKEPYRIEGKKTMGYEIAEQLGWTAPDVIVYPTGGGVGLIGIDKAYQEMAEMGWVPRDKHPRFIAVQSTACAPVVKAYEEGKDACDPWTSGERTIAFGITVPAPLGGPLVLEAVRRTGGTAIAVDDETTIKALHEMGAAEGMYICPEGAACLAAVRALRDQGAIGADERVVVINTGAGLKYPQTVDAELPVLPADGSVVPTFRDRTT